MERSAQRRMHDAHAAEGGQLDDYAAMLQEMSESESDMLYV